MKAGLIRTLLERYDYDTDMVIQLPDNEPPVDFTLVNVDPSSRTIVAFPLPPVQGGIWKHDTNINDYSTHARGRLDRP